MTKTDIVDCLTSEDAQKLLLKLKEDVKIIHAEMRQLRSSQSVLDGDAFLDTASICSYLSISDRQLRRYKKDGLITPTYFGRKCLYRTSEVMRFMSDELNVKTNNR